MLVAQRLLRRRLPRPPRPAFGAGDACLDYYIRGPFKRIILVLGFRVIMTILGYIGDFIGIRVYGLEV